MRLDFSSFDLMGIDWSPLRISCAAALIATAATFLLGLWAAWRLYRMRRRVRVVLDCLLTLPLVLPPTVMGLILLMIFGRQSLIGRALEALGTQVVFSFGATVICAVAVTFPLMYRTALGAFEQLDADVLSAARTLGMRESKVFFRVALPLAAPGVAAGAILSFARAMGEFGATLMLAGNIAGRTQTMPVAIYFALQGGRTELAVFWTAVMLAISLGSIALMQAVTGAQRRKA